MIPQVSANMSASRRDNGAVLLVTVIIVGALLLLMGLSAARIGQTEIIITGQMDRGQHARTMAAACLEEALLRLKKDEGYSGGTATVDGNTCTIIVAGSDTTRTVTSTASSDDFTRTIEVGVSLIQNSGSTAHHWNIDSWSELSGSR